MSGDPESDVDPGFPYRPGWGFRSGFIVFVVLNILVYITTGRLGVGLIRRRIA